MKQEMFDLLASLVGQEFEITIRPVFSKIYDVPIPDDIHPDEVQVVLRNADTRIPLQWKQTTFCGKTLEQALDKLHNFIGKW